MDVREKLVELSDIQVLQREIECVKRKSSTNCTDCLNCDLLMPDERILTAYKNAIDALQNEQGVTVRERGYWVSLTDCANAGVYCSVCHKKIYKEDYARCNRKNKLRSDYCPHCGSKMMPEPPKGE